MRVRAQAMIMAVIVIVGLVPGTATAAPMAAHLDPAFGGDGIVESDGLGVAVQPNGKVLARSSEGTTRYSASGEQEVRFPGRLIRIVGGDASTDSDVITADSGRYIRWNPDSTREWETDASTIQEEDSPLWSTRGKRSTVDDQGRVVVLSYTQNAFMFSETNVVSRFLPDGGYDPLFGVGGRVYLPRKIDGWFHRENIFELALVDIDPEGRILLGSHDRELHVGNPHCGVICLVRLLPNGALDPTFGTAGVSGFGTSTSFHSLGGIDFLPSGNILVTSSQGLFRLTADGHVDESFGEGGFVPFQSWFTPAAAEAPDGGFYITHGFHWSEDGPLRLLPDGTLDPDFKAQPRVRGWDIATDPEGRIFMTVRDASANYIYAFVVGEPRIATHLEVLAEGPGGSRQSLHATLTEAETAEPVVGETIVFLADGHEIGSSTTGSDGAATIDIPPGYRGSTTYAARFDGSAAYEPATASAP